MHISDVNMVYSSYNARSKNEDQEYAGQGILK